MGFQKYIWGGHKKNVDLIFFYLLIEVYHNLCNQIN